MKILHTVERYHPSIGGIQEAVKQLSERLAALGHEVTVATSASPARKEKRLNGVRIEEFNVSGNLAEGINGEVKAYQDFLLNSHFDIMANFAAQQWATDAALRVLDKIKCAKVFVPTGFSALYKPRYRKYFDGMKTWMKRYDMNVFLSDDYRDINFARENGIRNTALITNGADEKEFLCGNGAGIRGALGIPAGHLLILHVGSHTGAKGHDEAIEIFRRARIKNAVFLIAGGDKAAPADLTLIKKGRSFIAKCVNKIRLAEKCPCLCGKIEKRFNGEPQRKADGKMLMVRLLDRKDIVSAFKAADLFLFPSNIECSPIVLFECMASKTPYLSTDAGNAGEIIKWSGSGILLPSKRDKRDYSRADINGSAKMLEDLCGDPSARGEMAERGFRAWKERFTWAKIAADYEGLYRRLLTRNLAEGAKTSIVVNPVAI